MHQTIMKFMDHKEKKNNNNSIIAGDSGYPLETFLMTPVSRPITAGEHEYNNSHTKTRVVVEQTFGTLKSRFRCLHESGGSLQYHPEKCAHIAIACMKLHNICIQRRIPLNQPIVDDDDPEDEEYRGDVVNGLARRRALIENVFA